MSLNDNNLLTDKSLTSKYFPSVPSIISPSLKIIISFKNFIGKRELSSYEIKFLVWCLFFPYKSSTKNVVRTLLEHKWFWNYNEAKQKSTRSKKSSWPLNWLLYYNMLFSIIINLDYLIHLWPSSKKVTRTYPLTRLSVGLT